jgi:hypothetical protein
MDVQISMPPPPPPPPPPSFFAETAASQLTIPPPPPPPQPVTTTTTASVASPPAQDRNWLHPWTVAEMRDNASQWSLAGDAGVRKEDSPIYISIIFNILGFTLFRTIFG